MMQTSTCIVGIEHEGDVWIGGDSAGVDGNLGIRVRYDEKVFLKGDMVFGICGSIRLIQLLRHSFIPPQQAIGQDDSEYLCGPWIAGLTKCLKDNGCAKIENNEIEMSGEFLMGFNSCLYHVYADFQVGNIAMAYDACGCGGDYALGVMASTIDDVSTLPGEKITKALEVAEMFSAGVKGPFVIECLNEDNTEFTFTEE